jgi:hypothetical protein
MLIALPASATAATDPRRESLIQVHVDRIDHEDARNTLAIALQSVARPMSGAPSRTGEP